MGHVDTTLLVLADAVCVGRLLADEDDVAVLASHHVTGLGGQTGLGGADREHDDENNAEDDEAGADDDPGHQVLLVRQEGL